ncbi:hypothetical protein Acr_06g0007710 [Actinidia rufa]|uniref:Uncharacterized protein n=1 Tax=Actinidia rufa TaxID=165716 RepID=A0A7J0EQS2_9ERIC|nr:hypothetical protein Acr_06g0007710 [Actinidia rufa]
MTTGSNNLVNHTVAKLKRHKEEVEGESTGSSNSSSSNSSSSWDIDLRAVGEKEDEDALEPILVSSSDLEATDDLHFLKVGPIVKLLIEHFLKVGPTIKLLIEYSFNQGGSSGFSSEEEVNMAPKQQALGKKRASEDEPTKQTPDPVPTLPSLDHETCLALGNDVMLPQDVVELADEDSEGYRGRLIMMGAQVSTYGTSKRMKKHTTYLKKANQRIHALEKELKQAKVDLVASKKAAIHARDEAGVVIEEKNKAL